MSEISLVNVGWDHDICIMGRRQFGGTDEVKDVQEGT